MIVQPVSKLGPNCSLEAHESAEQRLHHHFHCTCYIRLPFLILLNSGDKDDWAA